jgi:hypothetical protein
MTDKECTTLLDTKELARAIFRMNRVSEKKCWQVLLFQQVPFIIL